MKVIENEGIDIRCSYYCLQSLTSKSIQFVLGFADRNQRVYELVSTDGMGSGCHGTYNHLQSIGCEFALLGQRCEKDVTSELYQVQLRDNTTIGKHVPQHPSKLTWVFAAETQATPTRDK